MDESDGLENRYGGNLIVGSNPTPSATFRHEEGSEISVSEPSFLANVASVWPEIFDCVAITHN